MKQIDGIFRSLTITNGQVEKSDDKAIDEKVVENPMQKFNSYTTRGE